MTVRMLVFWAVAVISVSLAANAADSTTIKGKIMNVDEVEKLIDSDSFLQLMPYPGKGTSLTGKSDARGRLTFESHLARVKMSKSGEFSISASHLEAGRYAVAGQNLEPSLGQIQIGPLFLCKKGERRAFEIKVPEDVKGPTLDIGEVFLSVANSKYSTKGYAEASGPHIQAGKNAEPQPAPPAQQSALHKFVGRFVQSSGGPAAHSVQTPRTGIVLEVRGSASIACTLPAATYLSGEKDQRMFGLKARFPCADGAPHPKVLEQEYFSLPTIEWSVNGRSTHTTSFDVTWSPEERRMGIADTKRLVDPINLNLAFLRDGKRIIKGGQDVSISFTDNSTFEMKDPFAPNKEKASTLVFKREDTVQPSTAATTPALSAAASKPTQLLALLVDTVSKKPVPFARIVLGRKDGAERECTIDTSLTATSNDHGGVTIPNVTSGEYVVFYNISGAINTGLNRLLVKYRRVFNDSYVKAMSETLGPLLVLKGSKIGVVEGLLGVENGYLHSSRFDVAVIVSGGDLQTLRMPATGNSPVTIEINTDLPGAPSPAPQPKIVPPMSSATVTLPTSGAGREPGETIRALGLTWQKAPPTQQMKWEEAKAYCAELTAGSWRLPTKDELVAFYTSPSYSFQHADNGWYWAGIVTSAWYISAIGGTAYDDGASNANRVRCVRR